MYALIFASQPHSKFKFSFALESLAVLVEPLYPYKNAMIKPPPEIRKIADKTAEYVALKGREIEAKIKIREAGNMKFSFLQSDDPYYDYYQHML